MVFEVVAKGVLPVINYIVVAQQVVSFEVHRREDVVAGVFEGAELSESAVEFVFQEGEGGLICEFIRLEEVEEVALLFEELQVIVDGGYLCHSCLVKIVLDGVVNEGRVKPFHDYS